MSSSIQEFGGRIPDCSGTALWKLAIIRRSAVSRESSAPAIRQLAAFDALVPGTFQGDRIFEGHFVFNATNCAASTTSRGKQYIVYVAISLTGQHRNASDFHSSHRAVRHSPDGADHCSRLHAAARRRCCCKRPGNASADLECRGLGNCRTHGAGAQPDTCTTANHQSHDSIRCAAADKASTMQDARLSKIAATLRWGWTSAHRPAHMGRSSWTCLQCVGVSSSSPVSREAIS